MRQLVVIVVLAGTALAMPQVARDNTFTKILSFESYQDGSNFGHELAQEDGTTSGQKFGPDGNLYGFYSYVQDDGNRVKVLWRAGQGIGYEVIGTEGINQEGLGNLRAPVSTNPEPAPVRQAPSRPPPVRAAPRAQPVPVVPQVPHHVPEPVHRPAPAPVHSPAPVLRAQGHFIPTPTPIVPSRSPAFHDELTPSPHRFDYPAVLNLERTSSGFVSSLQAV
ncbi:hypothetical protein OTU49_002688 [Cherax quadricarinatus]|uniref:Uncharacterized protein n=1 Tax=Cherax quadricarinatus TaxID=27406 RepID=A0AAW0XM73_CHEQU|nr:uncharacterized protein LOC128690126 [Cherax quadricarinatus]